VSSQEDADQNTEDGDDAATETPAKAPDEPDGATTTGNGTGIRVRGSDGIWRELTIEPPAATGDPEYDAVRILPWSQVKAMAKDPTDPRHDIAVQVVKDQQDQQMQRIRESLEGGLESMLKPFTDALGAAPVPPVDIAPARAPSVLGTPAEALEVEVPTNPMWHVLKETKETNARLGELLQTMAALYDVSKADADAARQDAADARVEAQESADSAKRSLRWTVVATLIALVTGAASIWLGFTATDPTVNVVIDQPTPASVEPSEVPTSPSPTTSPSLPTPASSGGN
jgi:hypothetical protein